jgi:addiction module HigA family antidote
MAKSTAKDPGTVLKLFLEEYQLNPSKLGKEVDLSQSTIRQITLNKIKISIPIALKFSKFFGNPVEFWLNLQTKYSLDEAAGDEELNEILKQIRKAEKPSKAQKTQPKAEAKKGTAESKKQKTAESSEPKAVKRPRAKKAQ